jgi:hypothetical protein
MNNTTNLPVTTTLADLLFRRNALAYATPATVLSVEDIAHINLTLLNKFGVYVDKPELVTFDHVKLMEKHFKLKVPKSFYDNPQDLLVYTSEQLLIEQLVSYFIVEINGVNSSDSKVFDRIPLFEKAHPKYKKGKEVELRMFNIIDSVSLIPYLSNVYENLMAYTRPWNEVELAEFELLHVVVKHLFKQPKLSSRENAVTLITRNFEVYDMFASSLDKKDLVKLSIQFAGEKDKFSYSAEHARILKALITKVNHCPLTKKQAKYFNTIAKKLQVKLPKESNIQSPIRLAKVALATGNVPKATAILAEHGSMLERNLVWLLSRAETVPEILDILSHIKLANPIVGLQLLRRIKAIAVRKSRTFKFIKNGRTKVHLETATEVERRQSVLDKFTLSLITEILDKNLEQALQSKPSLGKIFIEPKFKKVALPVNTSASGSGVGVLPYGSRVKLKQDYIRVFTHWTNAYDIDLSAVMHYSDDTTRILDFRTYHQKFAFDAALHSGDVRATKGAEYIDLKLLELMKQGVRKIYITISGYNDTLNEGEIFVGYQNKTDLMTKVWAPNNIAMQVQAKGESRTFIAFAIDVENHELIIVNQMMESVSQVTSPQVLKNFAEIFEPDFLTFNMYRIASLRGQVVDTVEDADVVLSDTYVGTAQQRVIKSIEAENLIALFN